MLRDPLFVWALVGGMALGTFVLRALFVLPGGRVRLSPGIERVLRFAPAAALMAIIAPQIAATEGVVSLSPDNPRLLAGLAAFAVAAATRSIILTIAAGMAVLAALRALG